MTSAGSISASGRGGFLFDGIVRHAVGAQQMPQDYQNLLNTLGKKGDYQEGVLKVNVPRNDL
jgi:hypothetical protein